MERRGSMCGGWRSVSCAGWLAVGLALGCGETRIGEQRHADPAPDTGSGSDDWCTGAVALSSGAQGNASCVVKRDGSLWCWGSGSCGSLGVAVPDFTTTPVAVARDELVSGVRSVSVGWGTTCAVTGRGAVACWGAALPWGNPWCSGPPLPTAVPGLPGNISSVATGYDHACALTTDGSAWCWGTNTSGQLGDGTVISRPTAEPIPGFTAGVLAISSGHSGSCALKAGGSLWCWGLNYAGQVGDGTATPRTAPVPVFGMSSGVTGVFVGNAHACAIKTDGSVWCWGNGGHGALGHGTTEPSPVPVRVLLTLPATALAKGTVHTCALVSDGTVWCWGSNSAGELGRASEPCDAGPCQSPTPAPVSGLPSHVIAVSAGYHRTCALDRNGTPWCWGKYDGGRPDDDERLGRSTPRRVLPCGE